MRAGRFLPVIVSAIAIIVAACADSPSGPQSARATPQIPQLGARFDWVTQTTCREWDIFGLPPNTPVENALSGGGYIESVSYLGTGHIQAVQCYQTEVWEDFNECRTNPSACIVAYPTTDGAEYYPTTGGGGGYAGGVYVPAPFIFTVSECNYELVNSQPDIYKLNKAMDCTKAMTAQQRAWLDTAAMLHMPDTLASSVPGHFTTDYIRQQCAQGYAKLPEALAAVDSFQVGKRSTGHGGQAAIGKRMAHIDPEYFNNLSKATTATARTVARQKLLAAALHEIQHAYLWQSHDPEINPPYSIGPFQYLNVANFGLTNSCIKS